MRWLEKLGWRRPTPAECRAKDVAALRRRVRDLEAELTTKDREIERIKREAANERLAAEEQSDRQEAMLRVRKEEIDSMSGMVQRYHALVEASTQLDTARAEAASVLARRPQAGLG